MFANDPRPASARLADITERLEGVPRYLESLKGRLDTPVARWVDIERVKMEGLPGLLETLEGWAVEVSWEGVERFRGARQIAEASAKSYL